MKPRVTSWASQRPGPAASTHYTTIPTLGKTTNSPGQGLTGFSPETIEEEDLCSSNHFILDRIAEKDSSSNLHNNLHRSGSDHEEEAEEADIRQVNQALHVYIRGPFGAPTSRVFQAQHAVLIGTGIGVTPFASLLQSIMHRLRVVEEWL